MSFNRELFDSVSSVYDEDPPFFRTLGGIVVERAGLPAGASVIDLGTGRGAVTLALRAGTEVGEITAVDVAPTMVAAVAELGLPDVRAVTADLADLPFSDATYDHAVSGFTLHILGAPQDAAREIHRILRPGGTLTWSMPGSHPDAARFALEYGEIYARFTARLAEPPPEMTPGAPPEQAFLEAGFEIVDEHHTPVSIPLTEGPDAPERYWEWTQTHGVRWLTDALPPEDATELRAEVIEVIARRHPTRGRHIMVAPRIVRMRREGG